MRWKREGVVLAVALAAMVGCARTKLESSWRDPAAQLGELQGKRVGAFVISQRLAVRHSGEDALARALTDHGVIGIPGYQLVGAQEATDETALPKQLRNQSLDALVLMRIVDSRQVLTYSGFNGPYYAYWPYYGYYGSAWDTAGGPGAVFNDTIVTVETTAYSLPDNKLLWTGVTETTDPRNLDALIKNVADKATKEMKKQGLVVR
jgi:hypothetical protein